MRFSKGVAPLSTCLGLLLALSGCGGGSGGSGGGNKVTTSTPVRSVISQSNWQLGVGEAMMWDMSVTGSGTATVDATAEWTYASNDVDIYVTNTSCTIEMFAGNTCAYTAKADSTTAKPERLTFSVTAAGNHRFWVVNFGPTQESGTLEVAMTQ